MIQTTTPSVETVGQGGSMLMVSASGTAVRLGT